MSPLPIILVSHRARLRRCARVSATSGRMSVLNILDSRCLEVVHAVNKQADSSCDSTGHEEDGAGC